MRMFASCQGLDFAPKTHLLKKDARISKKPAQISKKIVHKSFVFKNILS